MQEGRTSGKAAERLEAAGFEVARGVVRRADPVVAGARYALPAGGDGEIYRDLTARLTLAATSGA
jgi:hypothetical protein